MCIVKDCFYTAGFNYYNNNIPLFCKKHKLPSMIYVKRKKCLHLGCNTIPCFNYPTETKGLYCSKHKLHNMIDIRNTHNIFSIFYNQNLCKSILPYKQKYIKKKIILCQNGLCNNDAISFLNNNCKNCFIDLFPDSKIAIDYKTFDVSNILIDLPDIITYNNFIKKIDF